MDPAILTFAGIVFTGFVSTIVAIINSNARHAASEQKSISAQEQIQEEMSELKGSMKALNDGLENLTASMQEFKAESIESDELLKEGILSMARDCINSRHKKYLIQGYIDDTSKEALYSVYNAYTKLGGNGYIKSQMKDIDQLPVRPLIEK